MSNNRRGETYTDKPEGYYGALNMHIVTRISGTNLSVLDVGCASGRLLQYLREKNVVARAYGIEGFPEAAQEARARLDRLWEGNVETIVPDLPTQSLDYIIFGDVLEHLQNPKQVVQNLKHLLKPDGAFIVSLPNVNHYRVLWNLIAHNEWRYMPYGVMDATHLRWFTRKSIARLFEECGFRTGNFMYSYGSAWIRRVCRVLPFLGRFGGEQMVFVAKAIRTA